MDRGGVDFERRSALHPAGAFFVIRAKSNLPYRMGSSRASRKPNLETARCSGYATQGDTPIKQFVVQQKAALFNCRFNNIKRKTDEEDEGVSNGLCALS